MCDRSADFRRRRELFSRRMQLEVLESRSLLATFTVTNVNDTPAANLNTGADAQGLVSLRSAIMSANQKGGANTIILPENGTFIFSRGGQNEDGALNGDLDVKNNLTLRAPGNGAKIDAAHLDRVFEIFSGSFVTIQNVTIIRGRAASGGGIYNHGTLTLGDLEVSRNLAQGARGANASSPGAAGANGGNAYGGGIYNAAGATLRFEKEVVIYENTSVGGRGGDGSLGATTSASSPHGQGGGRGGTGGQGFGGGLYNVGEFQPLGTINSFGNNDARGGVGGQGGAGSNGFTFVTNGPAAGGIGGLGGQGGTGGNGLGGGIYSVSSQEIAGNRVSIWGNSTIGGVGGSGGFGGNGGAAANASSTTKSASGGRGGDGGAGGRARGGGLHAQSAEVSIIGDVEENAAFGGHAGLGGQGGMGAAGNIRSNSELARTGGQGGNSGGGGIAGEASGAGIYIASGRVELRDGSYMRSNDAIAGNGANATTGGLGGPSQLARGGRGGAAGVATAGGTGRGGAVLLQSGDFVAEGAEILLNTVIGGTGGSGGLGGNAGNVYGPARTRGIPWYSSVAAASGNSLGGGIAILSGTSTINATKIDANEARRSLGGTGAPGQFSQNGSSGGNGGNSLGGGIAIVDGTLSITDSLISNNVISTSLGGSGGNGGHGLGNSERFEDAHGGNGGIGGSAGQGSGGNIGGVGGTVSISQSEISGGRVATQQNLRGRGGAGGNAAQGSPAAAGTGGKGGAGPIGYGGGIAGADTDFDLVNVTMWDNSARGNTGGSGALGGRDGSGVKVGADGAFGSTRYSYGGALSHDGAGIVNLLNVTIGGADPNMADFGAGINNDINGSVNGSGSILLLNTLVQEEARGIFESQGHNLITNATTPTQFNQPGDLVGVSVIFGQYVTNGNIHGTFRFVGVSAAIDAGDDSAAPLEDQIGNLRPKGLHVDIGAFEQE